MKPPDRKDVKGPDTYTGDITPWVSWSKSFTRYVRRRDHRWPGLLEKIQELKGKPVTEEHEKQWARTLGIFDIEQFKDQLNEYLESFTAKEAKAIVVACGEHNALDAWRQLAERGFSVRPNHIHDLMRLARFPRAAVQAKDLEVAIASWESDVHTYEAASSEKIPDSQRRFNLLEMCPELLKKHLKMIGSEKLASYEAMKAEIAEWVADEVRRPTRHRAAALEQSGPYQDATGGACGDLEWDRAYEAMDVNQLMAVFLETPDEGMHPNQLNALVKNLKAKKGKGKGKGKPRKCYECDSDSHIVQDCPIRAERIAAGGPERLPRSPDVEMRRAKAPRAREREEKVEKDSRPWLHGRSSIQILQ